MGIGVSERQFWPRLWRTHPDVKSVGKHLWKFDARRAKTVGQLAMVVTWHADVTLLVAHHVSLEYFLHAKAFVERIADDFHSGRIQHDLVSLGRPIVLSGQKTKSVSKHTVMTSAAPHKGTLRVGDGRLQRRRETVLLPSRPPHLVSQR